MTVRQILEEYRSGPISTLTTEGRIYSIDQALSAIADEVEKNAEKYPVSDWDDGYNAAIRSICTLIRGQK